MIKRAIANGKSIFKNIYFRIECNGNSLAKQFF